MNARGAFLRFLIVAALLAGTTAFLRARSAREDLPPRRPLSAFSFDVGSFCL
jgi:hypothetical protein